ncbi:hypothetical protein [Rhizomonospora bruguierae]|uniref:hypothetical protein n=1 Tax=Rhizomonospora bruguierae TaxID=1581705 RepID=UPI0020BDFC09|nr:hypothetical protein [Micromonospora sp. NBRC 107566]
MTDHFDHDFDGPHAHGPDPGGERFEHLGAEHVEPDPGAEVHPFDDGDFEHGDFEHGGFADGGHDAYGRGADEPDIDLGADHLDPPGSLPDHDPAQDPGLAGETVGADPDLAPEPGDGGWSADAFPPALAVTVPEPIDGPPWIDPAALGGPEPFEPTAGAGAPGVADLLDYAAEEVPPGTDPWTALAGSPDPATSALARFWRG